MSSLNPKSRRDLWLVVQGRCPFPTKTNETDRALKSSVGSRKLLISSCLNLLIANFCSTSCAPREGLRLSPHQSVGCLVNEKKLKGLIFFSLKTKYKSVETAFGCRNQHCSFLLAFKLLFCCSVSMVNSSKGVIRARELWLHLNSSEQFKTGSFYSHRREKAKTLVEKCQVGVCNHFKPSASFET